jgi:hypothetical protein
MRVGGGGVVVVVVVRRYPFSPFPLRQRDEQFVRLPSQLASGRFWAVSNNLSCRHAQYFRTVPPPLNCAEI